MNPEKSSVSGWLYVYTLFIITLAVSPFIPLVSFFSSTPPILSLLYVTALIFVYKRNKYSVNINKITLVVTIIYRIYVLYILLISDSGAPGSILILLIQVNIVIIFISYKFLSYWYKSERIKNIFTYSSTKITQSQDFSSGEKSDTNITGVQMNNQLNTGHLAILNIVSLISCGMFIYTGLGVLFATPVSLVFSIFYLIIFTTVLKKNNAPAFAVYTITLTLVFAYASILFNIGIMTDSSSIDYLAPSLLGVSSSGFSKLFNQLLDISFYYLWLSIPLNLLLIKIKANKILFSIVPIFGLLLIGIHWGAIWQQLPELKAQAAKWEQEQQQKEQEEIERPYIFNRSKIIENTFKNHIYSIFTPPALPVEAPISECPYTLGILSMLMENSNEEGLNVNCLNDYMKPIGQIPITVERKPLNISIPNTNQFFRKGDVVVVVAELENPSMMRINANGNAAKDCACRMSPYDYSGVSDYMDIGTSTIYEQSVIQMQVTDKKRTVMMLYPINVNNIKNLTIKLSQFSNNPNVAVTLKEAALFSLIKASPDPEWLKKWSKKPNPFLGK